MRKNGVNRELLPISGGVCAPAGFRASGVRCGLSDEQREDLALIVAEKRCVAACVYSVGSICGAPVAVTKRHIKSGYARAVLVNGGVANLCVENGEALAQEACATLAKYLRIDKEEVIIASTGKVKEIFPQSALLGGLEKAVAELVPTEEGSLAAARAIMTTDNTAKQLSYSFMLGDIPCKIGAIFKGNARVSPNMATTLCFVTTDVAISSEMLQKALSAATRDTFNLMQVDGVRSPNDTVGILSSAQAGNYPVSLPDSDYEKFVYVLTAVFTEVCRRIVSDGGKAFLCKVSGTKSKRTARAIAKALVKVDEICVENLLGAMHGTEEKFSVEKAQISLKNRSGGLVIFDGGKALAYAQKNVDNILRGEDAALYVELNEGNYAATAIGRWKTF